MSGAVQVDDLKLRIEDMLGYVDLYGVDGFDDSRIEDLERIIWDCNRLMNDLDSEKVADSLYDQLYSVLKEVKPSSGIFSEIWEDEGSVTDYTDILVKNPMMSIETAKSYTCSELANFIARMPEEADYFISFKINGHGIRVVYEDGDLVSATSRGRSSASRDITQQMRWILGNHCEGLEGTGLVELRGELCLKTDRFEHVRETYNETIKSPFSAVASLIRPSASREEVEELSFLCYGLIYDNGFKFTSRSDEFMEIQHLGFEVPENCYIEQVSKDELLSTIKGVVNLFEENYAEFGYFCDGVVFEVDDRDLFAELGIEGNHNLGNIALKVGVWEQSVYAGVVQGIMWKRGKVKLSPVAIVSENAGEVSDEEFEELGNSVLDEVQGVLTAQGNRVKRVPLYEPKNILILEAYPGRVLNFRYGGEAGVVPCFPDGRLLKEDAVKDILENDNDDIVWAE